MRVGQMGWCQVNPNTFFPLRWEHKGRFSTWSPYSSGMLCSSNSWILCEKGFPYWLQKASQYLYWAGLCRCPALPLQSLSSLCCLWESPRLCCFASLVAVMGWTEGLEKQEQAGTARSAGPRPLPSPSQLLHTQWAMQPLLLPLTTNSPAVIPVSHFPSFPTWLEEHSWGAVKMKLGVFSALWSRRSMPQDHTGKEEGCYFVSHPTLSNAWCQFQMLSPLCFCKLCCKPKFSAFPWGWAALFRPGSR